MQYKLERSIRDKRRESVDICIHFKMHENVICNVIAQNALDLGTKKIIIDVKN